FKLSGTSHDDGKRAVRLQLQPSRSVEQITRTLARRKLRRVKHRWPVCGHIVSFANFRLLLVGQIRRPHETVVVHRIRYKENVKVGYTNSPVESRLRRSNG